VVIFSPALPRFSFLAGQFKHAMARFGVQPESPAHQSVEGRTHIRHVLRFLRIQEHTQRSPRSKAQSRAHAARGAFVDNNQGIRVFQRQRNHGCLARAPQLAF
jgi:hypothetical protein